MDINSLIKIADKLDSNGFSKEADFIDAIIKKAAEHASCIYHFAEDLIKEFKDIAGQPTVLPTINDKSIHEILQVIDNVLKKGQYGVPNMNIDLIKELESPRRRIGDGILALEDDIPKIQKEMAETTDPGEKRGLEMEYKKIQDSLKKLYEEVTKLKEGKRAEDKQNYEDLKAYLKSRGKEI